MSRRPDLVFLSVVALFVTTLLLLGAFVFNYSWQVFQFPLVVGGIVLVLSAFEVIVGGRPKVDPDAEQMTLRNTVVTLAWVVGIVPTVFVLGYAIGIPAFIAAYLVTHGFGWRLALILAASAFVVVYVGFAELLNVPLPLWPGSRWV